MGCVVEGCEKAHEARGYCDMHYRRWRLNGEPGGLLPTFEERFWSKVNKTDTCWLWTAQITPDGYGRFQVGSRKDGTSRGALAHRVAYELVVGPIPAGLQLDHLCRVRNCVRPDHLEPVTQEENMRRGIINDRRRGATHCPQDHEYTVETTYWYRGKRQCRPCAVARTREARRQKRLASAST